MTTTLSSLTKEQLIENKKIVSKEILDILDVYQSHIKDIIKNNLTISTDFRIKLNWPSLYSNNYMEIEMLDENGSRIFGSDFQVKYMNSDYSFKRNDTLPKVAIVNINSCNISFNPQEDSHILDKLSIIVYITNNSQNDGVFHKIFTKFITIIFPLVEKHTDISVEISKFEEIERKEKDTIENKKIDDMVAKLTEGTKFKFLQKEGRGSFATETIVEATITKTTPKFVTILENKYRENKMRIEDFRVFVRLRLETLEII